MKITIIGKGNMGKGLAALAQEAGHEVRSLARGEAVGAADLVILAVPYAAALEIAAREGFAGQVVLDISNPITPDFQGLVVGHTSSAAEEIQKAAPQARVVKGFNTIFAGLLASKGLQTFIAADDAEAKARVLDFARSGGFDARDAGPLSNARFLEPLGEMNIQFGFMLGQGPQIAPAWVAV